MYITEQFEILKSLGEGGGGAVYQARQVLSDRVVAVKMLVPTFASDKKSLQRFQREAKTISALDHPHIVKVYSFGISSDGRPFYAMEYLEGKTLHTLLKERGVLDIECFTKTFGEICSALNYAHEKGVIHRDLKPANIMIAATSSGEETVKLLDFGIASRPDAHGDATTLRQTGFIIGSPAYMSPEQCRGAKPDARSDIYSLACVMYESLTGKPPFQGDSAAEIMSKHIGETPPALAQHIPGMSIPPSLNKLIFDCLNKDPALRPQSAEELSAILQQAQLEAPVLLKAKRSAKTNVYRAAIILAVVGVAAGIAFTLPSLLERKSKSLDPAFHSQANWVQLERLFSKAEDLNRSGKYAESIDVYKKVLVGLDNVADGTVNTRNLNTLRYNVLRNMIKAKLHTKSERSAELLEDWKQCMEAAQKGFRAGTGEVCDARLQYAFLLSLTSEDQKTVAKVSSICSKAIDGYSERIATLSDAPFIRSGNPKALNNLIAKLSECNALLGHMYDLKGNEKKAILLLEQAINNRTEVGKYQDSPTLWNLQWLCRAQHQAKMKKEERKNLDILFSLMDSGSFSTELKKEILLDLQKFYLKAGDTKLSSELKNKYRQFASS